MLLAALRHDWRAQSEALDTWRSAPGDGGSRRLLSERPPPPAHQPHPPPTPPPPYSRPRATVLATSLLHPETYFSESTSIFSAAKRAQVVTKSGNEATLLQTKIERSCCWEKSCFQSEKKRNLSYETLDCSTTPPIKINILIRATLLNINLVSVLLYDYI